MLVTAALESVANVHVIRIYQIHSVCLYVKIDLTGRADGRRQLSSMRWLTPRMASDQAGSGQSRKSGTHLAQLSVKYLGSEPASLSLRLSL